MEEKLYNPSEDEYFNDPYIDIEEWRDVPIRHYFVHGGFKGTDIEGENEARFCLYLPEKDKYEGRFFQYLSPAPEDEYASEHLIGEDDKISFCLTHGAYFVISNQGGYVPMGDPSRLFKVSSNVAEFSRRIAKRIYDTDERPYGYVFGGSGGSFKTMGCMEATKGIWDGAVPYVMANPMAAPNVFAPRMRAMRLLREAGIKKVIAALEPGGNGDIYEGLNEEQKQALSEATKMGFPTKAWFDYSYMGDGALMVLVPTVYQMFPNYFQDFWEKEGYEGADKNSAEYRDRLRFVTKVTAIECQKKEEDVEHHSVDNSWVNTILGGEDLPELDFEDDLPKDAYLFHCRLRVLSGKAKGCEINISQINGKHLILQKENGGSHNTNILKDLMVGDEIMIDNSDAIAMQCFHRHQIPDETYEVYKQFFDEKGEPKYAQLQTLLAPIIAINGTGLLVNGNIHGKMIGLCSVMDESAFAWHGDWYRKAIKRNGIDEKDCFRLYYHDNSLHDDRAGYLDDPQRQVDYLGTLHQALLDVAAWCEQGIEPLETVNYKLLDGQVILPESADERGGMQPVVKAFANGEKSITIKSGETVSFFVVAEVAKNAGKITKAAWDFEGENDWSKDELLVEDKDRVRIESSHTFYKKGIFYPCIKVQSNRKGDVTDIYTQCKNLDRVRVEVV